MRFANAHVEEAVLRIQELGPDLVFLDIEMPGGTGFDVLERLEHVPLVVFTTAYDNHAIRAFEVSALDYLLKPVDPRQLSAAVEKAHARLNPATSHSRLMSESVRRSAPKAGIRKLCLVPGAILGTDK